MTMVVMGTGPIGGIIGGRLARAGNDVTFVDVDPEHVAAIRRDGLRVDVPDGSFTVRAPIAFPKELDGRFDMGFIAVRSNYTRDALDAVLPHLTTEGVLVSMQNGINLPLLEERVGPDRAIGVAIRMGCVRVAPGHVHTALRGHLYVGHLHGRVTPRLQQTHALLDAVIPTKISDNISGVLWSKLTYTCLGFFGSLADAPLAVTCVSPQDRRLLVDFFAEIAATAKAAGVHFIPLAEYHPADFDPANPLEKRAAVVDAMARSWKYDDRKGPLRQLLRGARTEADFTLAHVVCEGRRLQVATPICEKLLDMIHELESGKRRLGAANYAELAGAAASR